MIISKYRTLIFPILIAIFIFIASHQSKISIPEFGLVFEDKIIHFIVYLIFGLSLIFGLMKSYSTLSVVKVRYFVLLIGILYGASDEIHQYFISGRQCDIFDLMADSLGILLSLLIFKFFSKKIFHV